jgi:hypothetical protein
MEMKLDREQLQAIEQKARERGCEHIKAAWRRAYLDLAHACSVLDAFLARSSVPQEIKKP